MESVTIYVTTDQGYWGLGSTLEEAMDNAKVKRGHKCHIEVWQTPKSNLTMNEFGVHATVDGTRIKNISITSKAFKR